MATRKSSRQNTKARAKEVARDGAAVRDRVRELSVRTLRERSLSGRDVSNLVHDVFQGAIEGAQASIPQSGRSVLRQVFDGLREGVQTIASAGSTVAADLGERGRTLAAKDIPDATRRVRAANEEFLGAVTDFAAKASKGVRNELGSLVAKAEQAGPKVVASVKGAAKAADGRWTELAGETLRAGAGVTRRGAGAVALAAAGLLDGVAEVIGGGNRSDRRSRDARTPSKKKPTARKKMPTKKTGKRRRS